MAKAPISTSANLGFEDKLWAAADKLRGNMDASEYKHVVLGLVFLKYISDAFMEKYEDLTTETANPKSEYYVKEERARYGVAEDRDEYLADNIFWVPPEARWPYLQKNAKRPEIGTLVDDALAAIERDNKVLKGVLPKDYARPALDKARLGELTDRVHRELTDVEVAEIARTYHAWRGEASAGGQFGTGPALLGHRAHD
jgi:type I restriction enzyme M protein